MKRHDLVKSKSSRNQRELIKAGRQLWNDNDWAGLSSFLLKFEQKISDDATSSTIYRIIETSTAFICHKEKALQVPFYIHGSILVSHLLP